MPLRRAPPLYSKNRNSYTYHPSASRADLGVPLEVVRGRGVHWTTVGIVLGTSKPLVPNYVMLETRLGLAAATCYDGGCDCKMNDVSITFTHFQ